MLSYHQERTLTALRECWERYPQLRLGQLIHNIQPASTSPGLDIFYAPDHVLAVRCKDYNP